MESPSKTRRRFDIAVVIPLEEECEQFTEAFDLDEDFSTDILFRSSVVMPNDDLSMIFVKQEGMGRTHAGNAVASLLTEFDIGLVICLGIAGSLTDDLCLGDVCYSTHVFDVLDNVKASDLENGNLNLEFSPSHYKADRPLIAALNFIRMKKNLKPLYKEWQAGRGTFAGKLVPGDVPGRNGRKETLTEPKAVEGVIACAFVTKSEEYNKKLRDVDRKVMAVETESGSVFERASQHSIRALAIRGISDHADTSKNQLESVSKGAVRKIAASNAAHFLKLQLANPEFVGYVTKLREGLGIAAASSKVSTVIKRPLHEAFEEAEQVIRNKLKELCPEYQLQQKGYRLPIPRVRKLDTDKHIEESDTNQPEDIVEILQSKDSLIVILPTTYPDDSLSWVIADHLLANGIGKEQVLPAVIHGNNISPPKSTISHLASNNVDDIAPDDGIQVVYIIDGLQYSSRSKMNFLKEEIKSKPGAKFIFVCRTDTQIVELTEFSNEQSADIYQICPVSFRDIALFLQKNFSMSPPEAEVVAYRLSRTFNQFELAAHPSYFAGIPRETLSALLQANRRSELIQLAVDGFLTFVVADDKSDVTLSRTTRSRFLRNLVIETNVEKRNFSESELIEYTSEFSKKYDFAITPIRFIQGFIDKGIIHFDSSGFMKFSLPFVESYLLASELSQKDKLASQYYDLKSEEFDFHSFDLYCEIAPSDALIREYMDTLKSLLDQFQIPPDEEHILLSDKIHPVMLGSQDRLQMLQKKVRKAQEDVADGKGDVKAKQRILDIVDHVKVSIAEESKIEEGEPPEDNVEEAGDQKNINSLQHALGVWALGVVILGSGAEHLTGETKQTLTNDIVRLGSMLVHRWTKNRLQIDFKDMKRKLTSDENVSIFFNENGKHIEDLNEAKKLIEMMVDLIEYYMLSQPLRRTLGHLCEQARQKVLAESVSKPKFEHPVEKVIHSAWLTDIESGRGKEALHEAIRALPASMFLRINLASHFLTRVHWNHWKKDDRLVLLDMAEEAIKPLSVRIRKGDIMRAIEKDAENESDKPQKPA
ncbi:hypothetical protein [Pleomorphomonas sp. PLEO]|uniref:phosphorylase family protein n=1 Tax=Pleomorphomonas sp. PLEO TaxID=3239306 RepID=UPI00351F1446